jgi:hypothetical protein
VSPSQVEEELVANENLPQPQSRLGPADIAALEMDEDFDTSGTGAVLRANPVPVAAAAEEDEENAAEVDSVEQEDEGAEQNQVSSREKPLRVYNQRANPEFDKILERAKGFYEKHKHLPKGSLRKVAKKFNINRNTFQKKLQGLPAVKPGRITALAPNEDDLLVNLMKKVGSWGFPLSYSKLAYIVEYFLSEKYKAEMKVRNLNFTRICFALKCFLFCLEVFLVLP